jgi:hypothetical protein
VSTAIDHIDHAFLNYRRHEKSRTFGAFNNTSMLGWLPDLMLLMRGPVYRRTPSVLWES